MGLAVKSCYNLLVTSCLTFRCNVDLMKVYKSLIVEKGYPSKALEYVSIEGLGGEDLILNSKLRKL